MMVLLTGLAAAIITGIIGNALVQKWQLRSWFRQQRQLGHQQELDELKKLLEELATRADARLHAMRELINALSSTSQVVFDKALADYRKELASWNKSINSFYARVRYYVSTGMSVRLERDVHDPFVYGNRELEPLLRSRIAGGIAHPTSNLNLWLMHSQRMITIYMQDLLARIERRREVIANGKVIYYVDGNLREFSTLLLIKALFMRDVNSLNIVRPA